MASLMINDPKISSTIAASCPVSSTSVSKVVLVSRDELIHDIFTVKFNNCGIRLLSVTFSDDTFVDQMAREMPDFILMAIVMQKYDGFRLTEMLKADQRTRSIRIIGFSNCSQPEEIVRAKRLGMEDYWIASHFTPDEILTKLQLLSAKI